MRWFTTPFGRKNLEAVTGLLLLGFTVEHLLGNSLLLLDDPTPYTRYTTSLGHSLIVRVLEVALFLLFASHIGVGLYMRWHHRHIMASRPRAAKLHEPLATRMVSWTGIAIMLFMVIHLWRFFVPNRITAAPGYDLYADAYAAFASLWYVLFYAVIMGLLSFHLVPGIKSAVVNFKRIPRSVVPTLRHISVYIAWIVPILLAMIPVIIYVKQLLRP
jgi:succinate dehydrogenase/fumarate reductase cytochrome b subunit (b558 family)